jgi:hypothetical protein
MNTNRLVPAVLALLGAAACSDPTSVHTGSPGLRIGDATHHFGNVHFSWLKPVVPTDPLSFNGAFNGNFYPKVVIC